MLIAAISSSVAGYNFDLQAHRIAGPPDSRFGYSTAFSNVFRDKR